LSIPFVPTVRAAELITYHSFNDLILLRDHYKDLFNYRISTVSWHTGKSAQDIYATALTILQLGQPTIRLPPNPDFNSLSLEEKIGYIKTFTIKSTALFHRLKPLLTQHYCGETLDQLWNQV
jgi:hypothetical protein